MRMMKRGPVAVLVLLPLALAVGYSKADGIFPVAKSMAPTIEASPADTVVAGFAARYGISHALAQTIHDHAVRGGIRPTLVFGLIATESSFNPRARGPAGALGLMQIMPSTARIYDRDVTPEQLLRPEVNLRLGLRHLLREVEFFGHDWTLGLLAYNMGRGAVRRALGRGVLPRNAYAAKVLAHCQGLCS